MVVISAQLGIFGGYFVVSTRSSDLLIIINSSRLAGKESLMRSQYQWRTQGGGGRTPPPPETGKIVVEIWCYLPEVYTFGAESEIQEIFSRNCEKSQFSI